MIMNQYFHLVLLKLYFIDVLSESFSIIVQIIFEQFVFLGMIKKSSDVVRPEVHRFILYLLDTVIKLQNTRVSNENNLLSHEL